MVLTFQELERMVNDVYTLRDTYYKSHPKASAEVKKLRIKEEITKVTAAIEEGLSACKDAQSADMLFFLKGKLFNLSPALHSKAKEILTRHVKLYPQHGDAWNILGECFWNLSDLMNASNCFNQSIELAPNSVAFRSLSMLFRTLPGNQKEVKSYMTESLLIARKAVAFDINDGKNWFVLGNVYVAMYFKTDQDPNWLVQAVKAYSNASRYDNVKNDPDFYFNRGVAHSYLENFGMAMESFDMAHECDPNWSKPVVHKENLETFIKNCQDSIATKGNMKSRKLKDLLKSLKSIPIESYERSYKKIQDGKVVAVPLTTCNLADLAVGENPNKVILGKMICHVYSPAAVTFTFCIIDDDGPCKAVNLYNIAEGKGLKIGDTVAIPEPFIKKVEFTYKNKKHQFDWIKVDNPLKLIVNGKRLSDDNLAVPLFQSTFNPES